MNILVVDDDGTNRKLLRVKLEAAGHRVVEAEDGVQALGVLAREPVDGIISDVLMPNMDGYRFCLEVRKNPRLSALPFVIYTATFTSPGDEGLALEVGADEYLIKPASIRTLLEALTRAGSERRLRPSHIIQEHEELLLVREYSDLLVRKLEEKHRDLQRQTGELQRSEERSRALAAIVESSDDAIVGKTLDGTITSWNQGAVALYGYSAEETIGKHISMVIPPDRPDEWREIIERIKQAERADSLETTRRRKDGSLVAVSLRLSPIRDASGAIVGVAAIARDITQRKALERELALREQQLRAFFSTAAAGMAILDADLRFLQINEALAATNGLPVSEHLGKTVREIIPNLAPILEPVFQYVLATGEPVLNLQFSGETRARPGVSRHWVASYFAIKTNGGKPEDLGAVVVEITDLKRTEEELGDSREQLRALAAHLQMVREEERTRISREIHDELGQMLTGLKMDLRWVENRMTRPLAAGDQKTIEQKIIEAERLADSTIDAIQRIAADLRPSILDAFGLNAALGFEARRFEKRAGIQVTITAPEDLPALDRDVATAIFRVFQETLTNVARHSGATAVNVRLRDQGSELLLEVKDDGNGIFADAASKRASLGLLGMSERVRSQGGHMYLHGVRDKGTTVTVRIPCVKPGESSKDQYGANAHNRRS
jgi:PAS domain S-box-containing protein